MFFLKHGVCSQHKQLPHIIGAEPQWVMTNIWQKATVVNGVRESHSNKRLNLIEILRGFVGNLCIPSSSKRILTID